MENNQGSPLTVTRGCGIQVSVWVAVDCPLLSESFHGAHKSGLLVLLSLASVVFFCLIIKAEWSREESWAKKDKVSLPGSGYFDLEMFETANILWRKSLNVFVLSKVARDTLLLPSQSLVPLFPALRTHSHVLPQVPPPLGFSLKLFLSLFSFFPFFFFLVTCNQRKLTLT